MSEPAPDPLLALASLLALCSAFLLSGTRPCRLAWDHGFLSISGGVSVAYVFLRLIPELGKRQAWIASDMHGVLPFVEKHVYLMSLIGILVFAGVDSFQAGKGTGREGVSKASFWLRLAASASFMFSLGYAVMDKNDADIQPLLLFTIAMWLQCFVLDHGLREREELLHHRVGRWILVGAALAGGGTGVLYELNQTAVGLVVAFIAGGSIMGVMRYAVPTAAPGGRPGRFLLFLGGCVGYSAVLLTLP